jgi:phenylalanyl-tRNA synthetase beta chain
MQFPESWLREFCNPPLSTQALADLLTMSGMEVEELRPVAPAFTGVVVAEVLAVERHPNADRLNVCQVNVGQGKALQIVCGAPNVQVGIKVPCALVGAELAPSDEAGAPFEIKLGKLRGVESQGMLCSARELKLSDESSSGLYILSPQAPVGQSLREHLQLDDTLFTLKLTPNLGHALSVYGIAREVAALTGSPLKSVSLQAVAPGIDQRFPVRIDAPDLCGRFSGRVIRGVNPQAATPPWMVERLARCGQRSVSALVDISNYVMFESGQPSHIFDLDKIQGGLVVRWGREGEQLKLLNGNTIGLDAQVGVIADQHAVESLAGIMGGDASAVSDDTQNIYVEAAFWWPQAVVGRSRRYAFSTEAGHRFERGVDPASTVERIERITQLILDICGGQAGPIDDQILHLPERQPVALRVERAAKVIGMPVTQTQCADVLQRLGVQLTHAEGVLHVRPPTWRFDLQIEEDLIEEVIRVIGFNTLPLDAPKAPVTARVRSESRQGAHAVRHRLADLGYFETINFSFVEEKWEQELAGNHSPIRVLNPIASPLSVMRSSLMGGLIQVLRRNLAHKTTRVRVFEIGRIFERDDRVQEGPLTVRDVHQPVRVAGLISGSVSPLQWAQKERPVDFFDIKGDVQALFGTTLLRFVAAQHPALHPGRSAQIFIGERAMGFVGELHPRWRQSYELPSAPMLFEVEMDAALQATLPQCQILPKHQSVLRDLSLELNSTHRTVDAVIDCVKTAASSLIRNVTVFDRYVTPLSSGAPQNHVCSIALRLELLDEINPLTDERVAACIEQILTALDENLGVRLRGDPS